MKKPCTRIVLAAALLSVTWFGVGAAEEQQETKPWSDSAELSWVVTAGNSETMTLGFKNSYSYTWERALFKFDVGGLKAENTTVTRTAVAPDPLDLTNYRVIKTEDTSTTAENYFALGNYDRNITDKFFWYVGAGWTRNEFAGIKNRYIGSAGVGNIWRDEDRVKFRTTYGVSFTKQDDVVSVPGTDDSFVGVLFAWDYSNKFGDNTTYENKFDLNLNLDESSDWRSNMVNSVTVTMTEKLALKASLLWLYNNEPAFELVSLESPAGTPTGTQVPVQLDELDTVFTTSLVVDF